MNMYWNHNSAYYPWVKKRTANCRTIPDVGCGDGSLAFFLDDGIKTIVGIDPDIHCMEKASSAKSGANLDFFCCSFEEYTPDKRFDAIVFVASIHHIQTSEELNISTFYDYPAMNDIRSMGKEELPGARIHYALHYRYLPEWPAR